MIYKTVMRTTQGGAAFFALLLGIIFTASAYWNTDAEVYLFPRIAAGLMLLLGLIQFIGLLLDSRRPGSQTVATGKINWRALLPGIAVGAVYVMVMEQLGFYVSSFAAFVMIVSIYGKRSAFNPRAFARKALIGLVFTLILYLLFWKLLNVRTPTGLLF